MRKGSRREDVENLKKVGRKIWLCLGGFLKLPEVSVKTNSWK
jgi:hypothetical protein